MPDEMMDQFLEEYRARIVHAVEEGIRLAFGNMGTHGTFDVFVSAEAERLAALSVHDVRMYLLRIRHGGVGGSLI